MKWLFTGLNGTLAPVVAATARAEGIEILQWDRSALAPEDTASATAWLDAERPDAMAHLATGSVEWAGWLAAYAARQALPFLFTSTAMVFHHQPDGPHRVHDERNAVDAYGRYKRDCEDAVLHACPHACVARIGWQIDPRRPGNNMLMALDEWQAREQRVAASQAWRPACSFMEDTAVALVRCLREGTSGVRHIDSNADEGHDFLRIVRALKTACAREAWIVHPTQDYVHDQRLEGGGHWVPPLSFRLEPLRHLDRGGA